MKVKDLYDKTLREILEDYVVLHNLECDFYYGIAPDNVVEKMFEKYNVEEYEEAMNVETLIDIDLVCDDDIDLIDDDKVDRIMSNLGISKRI